jgi:hypothetical protein
LDRDYERTKDGSIVADAIKAHTRALNTADSESDKRYHSRAIEKYRAVNESVEHQKEYNKLEKQLHKHIANDEFENGNRVYNRMQELLKNGAKKKPEPVYPPHPTPAQIVALGREGRKKMVGMKESAGSSHPDDSRFKLYASDEEKGYTCHHIPASEAKPGEMRFKHTLGKEVVHSHSKYYPDSMQKKMNESVDTVKMDIPLLIRLLEYAKETAKDDVELHKIAEKLAALGSDTLTMDQYSSIVESVHEMISEELDELNLDTLKSYAKKAHVSAQKSADKGIKSKNPETAYKHFGNAADRHINIHKANGKIASKEFSKKVGMSEQITFSTFMSEYINESTSDDNGKIHELLVANNLNGGKHTSPEAKALHDHMKSNMAPDHYKREVEKAGHASDAIRKHLGGKKIERVGLVSKAGDIGRFTNGHHNVTQQEDASDVMIHHGGNDYTGISLKSTQSHSAKAGVHNEGHGAVDKRLGTDTKHHVKAAKQSVVNQHHALAGMSDVAAKAHIKAHADVAKSASEHGAKALKNIADDWHGAYSKMSSEERSKHLRHVLHATPTAIPHIRSTTSGTTNGFKNKIVNPATEHDHYINDHKNIHIKRRGNAGIEWSHHDPKSGKVTVLANERAKFASGLASPVKTSVN